MYSGTRNQAPTESSIQEPSMGPWLAARTTKGPSRWSESVMLTVETLFCRVLVFWVIPRSKKMPGPEPLGALWSGRKSIMACRSAGRGSSMGSMQCSLKHPNMLKYSRCEVQELANHFSHDACSPSIAWPRSGSRLGHPSQRIPCSSGTSDSCPRYQLPPSRVQARPQVTQVLGKLRHQHQLVRHRLPHGSYTRVLAQRRGSRLCTGWLQAEMHSRQRHHARSCHRRRLG